MINLILPNGKQVECNITSADDFKKIISSEIGEMCFYVYHGKDKLSEETDFTKIEGDIIILPLVRDRLLDMIYELKDEINYLKESNLKLQDEIFRLKDDLQYYK